MPSKERWTRIMGNANQSASLTGKMLKDLLSGLAVGIYMIFLLYLGGMNMLQQYFSIYYTKEMELVGELWSSGLCRSFSGRFPDIWMACTVC